MKKIIRIILSPIVFIIILLGVNAILPIGIACLVGGTVDRFYCWLMNKQSHTETWLIFAGVFLPYIAAKEFIEGKENNW